ncbi:ARM repeat-containing protein [Pleurotus eryngii]|uniref:ARM repeat-containing protein n=1 Tax=Pleurotus eryngii TaxID=5323 RepID=A0A9P5ZGN0_PLEER|nr:ARM repeat-containing protein [Pleurotus eryngii]
MNASSLENGIASSDNWSASDDRKQSPPAFLDLAGSRVELKRLEHERQRLLQRKFFEDQMRALEVQQAQELLSIPYDPSVNGNNFAVSAPTTPPRINTVLNGDANHGYRLGRQLPLDAESLSQAVRSAVADKRKSVTYAPSVNLSPDLATTTNGFTQNPGAKSMPASRRTSASSLDEELASQLQGLSFGGDRSNRASPVPGSISTSILAKGSSRFMDDEGARYASTYNAGTMLNEQLDQEMHNAMRHLPTSDEDKFGNSYPQKTSSAALDLTHIWQAMSPQALYPSRSAEPREKSSEWPPFPSNPRAPEGLTSCNEHRNVTSPNVPLHDMKVGMPNDTTPASAVPHIPKTPGTLRTPNMGILSARITSHGSSFGDHSPISASDLGASLSCLLSGQFDGSYSPNGSALDESMQYGVESMYGMNGGAYGRATSANSTKHGSTALYHHNGSRYRLSAPARPSVGGPDSKMGGLHGPKHKRGDIDREFNRFAGTRLEDLQGEIVTMCKDQYGCRFLQKKLEEGVPEHRDMIFRETFNHFPELMTDPFGNYLCQKLLEYSTDEQRNLICESVAQDLVNISLNMHGTRAVQKMIDFLSTRRQIHSIILALSLHVVVLIKDLNGNHIIQKCLNKLALEDNQFIYNAVAANCVEVATHRHGCCVLQRCIDHASESQHIQLVNEITFNALTLVQDPYGNYVVQYILDLNDSHFSDAVIRQFQGNVCALSVQKFSSNVIEKCVRVAEHSTRKMLIEEFLNRSRLEKLLRDSYGNYCVQTALDYAEPNQRALLVEDIRPVLPLIRNTPYGKRIQNKLQRIGGHGAARHVPQAMHPSAELYATQNSMYQMQQGATPHSPVHLTPQMHSLQAQGIDGYVLQGGSPHASGLPAPAHLGGFSNPFAGVGPFAVVGLAGPIADLYQKSSFGYGM